MVDRDMGFPYDRAMEWRPMGPGARVQPEPDGEGGSCVAVRGYEENGKEVLP